MKITWKAAFLWAALFLLSYAVCTSAQEETGGGVLYWTCGMHPSVKADGPGKCPICFMALVPVAREAEAESVPVEGREAVELRLSPDAIRLARISTVEVALRRLAKVVRSVGEVGYDETRMAVISARVGGRIEKLYADFTGKEFHAGEPLALLYSPELLSAQQEYLLAKGTGLEAPARRKLLLWGITEEQIMNLDQRREPNTMLVIHAPIGGTIVHKNVIEGAYVKEGDPLFHIADLSRVWITASVFEKDLGLIKIHQEALIASEARPGEEFGGHISFIDPFIDRATRSATIRIEMDNPERRLLPGLYVDVEIRAPLTAAGEPGHVRAAGAEHGEEQGRTGGAGEKEAVHGHGAHAQGEGVLAVPRSAVINTGKRTVAYVEVGEGRYAMREIVLGPLAEGFYVVLDGLMEGERVVEQGSFLLDSQTQLTGRAEEIYGGALGKESGEEAAPRGHRH